MKTISRLSLCGFLLAALAVSGHAQKGSAPEYATALSKTVHLTLGKTTLTEALTVLSHQIGIQIDAMEYLKDRELVVQIDGFTGRAALDALTALNDLNWKVAGPGHIVVTRLTLRAPEKITDVPELLLQAFPKDMRDCLLLGVLQSKGWEFAKPEDFPRKTDFTYRDLLDSRSSNVLIDQSKRFLGSLPTNLPIGTKIPYSKLKPDQKAELLHILFFQEICRLPHNLLHDQLAPYQKDVKQASLHFHAIDNLLEIGTITREGDVETEQFFGAPIAPPPTKEMATTKP